MNSLTVANKIRDHLFKHHDARYRGEHWLTLSCVFCGDSPNPKTTHLHIRLPKEAGDDMFMIKCFQSKCDVGAALQKKHLLKLGISDMAIINHIETVRFKRGKSINIETHRFRHEFPPILPEVAEYFLSRTGIVLTKESAQKYGVVTTFSSFYDRNTDIVDTKYTKQYISREARGKRFIYFLNDRETMMYTREIDGDYKSKLSIHKLGMIERQSPYIFKSEGFDKYNNPWIFITEAPFDAIGAEQLIAIPNGIKNGIFLASGGASGLKRVFRYVTKHIPNANVVFPADPDIKDYFIKNIIKGREYRCNNIYIVRNKAGKDFGDIRDKVDPYMVQIK